MTEEEIKQAMIKKITKGLQRHSARQLGDICRLLIKYCNEESEKLVKPSPWESQN